MKRFIASIVVGACASACATETGEAPDDTDQAAAPILAPQRSASAYTEAVAVQVNNAAADFCSGVLVAPRVVLTAAHCVAFNPDNDGAGPRGTWTVTVPFATTGAQTITASSGEPLDPAFYALSVANYDSKDQAIHDIGILYLDTAVTGVTFPSFSATRYPAGVTTVSAVGRASVSANAGLVLSKAVALSATDATDGYPNDNKTPRVTDGGDSGGPLFIDGTHTLVGLESRFNPTSSLDYWVRLDGVAGFIQGVIAAHGGARDPVYDFTVQVSAALCGRAAACCIAQNASYVASPSTCRTHYGTYGFESTARALRSANPANVAIDANQRSTCLGAIGNTAVCTVTSAAMKANLASCIAAVSGLVGTGGGCTSSVECSGNAACELDAAGAGTCRPVHATGTSCEVAYKGGSIDQRYDLAQELCTKRSGGSPAAYCDAYDFAGAAYKAETAWTCQPVKANGASCGANAECASAVCAPAGTASQFTCVASAAYVTAGVCAAFQ